MYALTFRPLSVFTLAALLMIGPVSAFAQSDEHHSDHGQAPAEHDSQNEHGGMTEGGMKGGHMMGGEMKGGPMMGGDMTHMMQMMHERLSHAGDRIATAKTELKITDAQLPAWNKFADALLAAAKSMDEAMQGMDMKMMHAGAEGLPTRLDGLAKMAAKDLASLQAIHAALDPLYASFSDEQKKLADDLKIGPMGLM
jgi:LTXXQ motif family protein